MQFKKQLSLMRTVLFLFGLGILFITASQANGQTKVCKDAALPAGYIIYGESFNDYGCRTGANLIKRPDAIDTMCRLISPLPAGYIIYGESTTNTRNGCRSGINSIKRPAAFDTMCKLISPVPAGYIIYTQASSSGCLSGAWGIKVPAAVDAMCRDISPLPAGYIITGASSLSGCPARNNTSNAVAIKRR